MNKFDIRITKKWTMDIRLKRNIKTVSYILLGLNETISIIDPESFKFWNNNISSLSIVVNGK